MIEDLGHRQWLSASDRELCQAMDALDASIAQPESGLKLRFSGPFARADTPHHEFWQRSLRSARFGG